MVSRELCQTGQCRVPIAVTIELLHLPLHCYYIVQTGRHILVNIWGPVYTVRVRQGVIYKDAVVIFEIINSTSKIVSVNIPITNIDWGKRRDMLCIITGHTLSQ